MLLSDRTSLFRNHPILVATTAASGGVLLGAYVALQLLASPVQRMPPSGLQPTAEAKAAKAPETSAAASAAAETTGSAPRQDSVASVDRCAGQTWPNLTRGCMEQMQSQRAERSGATDPTEKAAAAPAPQPNGAVASNAAPAPSQTQIQPQPPAQAATPPAVPTAAPASAPVNAQAAAAQSMPAQDTAANASSANDSAASAKAEKRKIREAKRKAKKQRREEFDDRALAYTPNEGGDDEDARADRYDRRSLRGEGRAERSRRERVVVRGEDDDSAFERDGRRVYVIRRGAQDQGGFGGGIFGGLFGN